MGILKVVSVWCDRMNDCGLIYLGFQLMRLIIVNFDILSIFSILAFSPGVGNWAKLGDL